MISSVISKNVLWHMSDAISSCIKFSRLRTFYWWMSKTVVVATFYSRVCLLTISLTQRSCRRVIFQKSRIRPSIWISRDLRWDYWSGCYWFDVSGNESNPRTHKSRCQAWRIKHFDFEIKHGLLRRDQQMTSFNLLDVWEYFSFGARVICFRAADWRFDETLPKEEMLR